MDGTDGTIRLDITRIRGDGFVHDVVRGVQDDFIQRLVPS